MDQVKGFLAVNGEYFGILGPECTILGSGKYPDGLESVLETLRKNGIEVEGRGLPPDISPIGE